MADRPRKSRPKPRVKAAILAGDLLRSHLESLPNHQPSRLGFGTSGIMGASLTSAGRLRLLEHAFAQGIRHFDTAPLYGMGLAEEVVGRFARGRRGEITITTKFGLAPRAIPPRLRPMMPIARALHRKVWRRWRSGDLAMAVIPPKPQGQAPGLEPVAASAPPLPTAMPPGPASGEQAGGTPYSEAAIRESLETSLRKLGSDYIDYFLLHEGQSGHVNEAVIALLENLVREGKIRHYGLGSGRSASWSILTRWPAFQGVVQIPDHLFQTDTGWFAAHAAGPLFTHSVLQTPLRTEQMRSSLDQLLLAWAERTGQDPTRPGLLSELLLTGGLLNNPEGCVLFSTSRAERIAGHVQTLQAMPGVAPMLQQLLADTQADRRGS
ncbi:MAG: aldo/keto reductase [Cyanobacteriota bacterium]